jgi:hypothetical protein
MANNSETIHLDGSLPILTDIRRTNSLFAVLAFLDRHKARVPVAGKNLLTAL